MVERIVVFFVGRYLLYVEYRYFAVIRFGDLLFVFG